MHLLKNDEWETFIDICDSLEMEVDYALDEEKFVSEISFFGRGQTYSREVEEEFVNLGGLSIAWLQIDPDNYLHSLWLYEQLQQKAPELIPHAQQIAADYRTSIREPSLSSNSGK